jgi:hypothetical protein
VRQGLIALVALLAACASNAPPPGGPEDKTPPRLVKVTPDTNAVNVHDKAVTFQFDETINDRGAGAQEVSNYFLVSPSDGAPRVSWHRSRIDVSPRHGFRPNTAYTVTLLPGLSDLRNNIMKNGASVVFSTGPTIPTQRINGIAFDWIAERPAAKAYVEALSPDSIVYLAQADSNGRFSIGPLGPGSYLVRAIIDANGNRALDRNELYDTLRVTVPQAAPVELLAAQRDTLPPLMSVTSADSVTLKVSFDRPLDPAQPLGVSAFRLVAADSTPIPITDVLTPRQERQRDSVVNKVRADSARRSDSLAGKPLPPVFAPVTPRAVPATGAKAPPAPPPVPSLPPPYTTLTLKLGRPLAPNAVYRLSVTGARALGGKVQSSQRSFNTPKPPPPLPAAKDTVKTAPPAAKDTVKTAPPAAKDTAKAAPAPAKPPAGR